MEPVMWLEILSRHHDVTARHRCAGTAIRIGRGYDNDVVLDDPFVAPYHLRVARTEDGGWVAQDLGTANGIRAEHGKARFETAGLDGERIIRIGHTLLRLRSTDHPVAAERLDKRRLPLWPVALLLIFGIVGIELVSDWLSETAEPRLSAYLGGLVQIGMFAVGWVGLWTILCRVFTGQARFERHLTIALAGIFAYSLTDEILKYVGFALSLQGLLSDEYLVMWVIIAVISFGHLQQIAPRRWRLTAGVVVTLAIVAGVAETLADVEVHRNFDPPPLQGRLYSPELRLAAPQADDQFFDEVGKLRDKLQSSRKDDDR